MKLLDERNVLFNKSEGFEVELNCFLEEPPILYEYLIERRRLLYIQLTLVFTSRLTFKCFSFSQVTTCFSFGTRSKLIFQAEYVQSYFNLKLSSLFWDTRYMYHKYFKP